MREPWRTISFAFILGCVCAMFLTGASRLLRERIERNQRLERMRNVLRVLRIPLPNKPDPATVEMTFRREIEEIELRGITLYRSVPAGGTALKGVAFPIGGKALWGPVKGFLALEPDLRTVRGIIFYEQEETPGLGARIAEDEFQNRFVGKKIVSPDGKPGLHIVKNADPNDPNAVDAITAATMTCQAVDRFLNENIRRFLEAIADKHGGD